LKFHRSGEGFQFFERFKFHLQFEASKMKQPFHPSACVEKKILPPSHSPFLMVERAAKELWKLRISERNGGFNRCPKMGIPMDTPNHPNYHYIL
jgi:hypothetical protein